MVVYAQKVVLCVSAMGVIVVVIVVVSAIGLSAREQPLQTQLIGPQTHTHTERLYPRSETHVVCGLIAPSAGQINTLSSSSVGVGFRVEEEEQVIWNKDKNGSEQQLRKR